MVHEGIGNDGDISHKMLSDEIRYGTVPRKVRHAPLVCMTPMVIPFRYTKAQIDSTNEFTISVPLGQPIPSIAKVCGMQSGRDIDKETEAHLTLENPEKISVPGIKEYPLTLECKVLYSQRQELESIPDDIREKMYPQDVDGTYPMANRDAHTEYIGEIVAAYIIK